MQTLPIPSISKTVAVGCDRLPIGAHGKEGGRQLESGNTARRSMLQATYLGRARTRRSSRGGRPSARPARRCPRSPPEREAVVWVLDRPASWPNSGACFSGSTCGVGARGSADPRLPVTRVKGCLPQAGGVASEAGMPCQPGGAVGRIPRRPIGGGGQGARHPGPPCWWLNARQGQQRPVNDLGNSVVADSIRWF
jgi:hypothetical protein